jgi:hypothetical protein
VSLSDWIYDEYAARVTAGKSNLEAYGEIKALIEDHGRVTELWRAHGQLLIEHIVVTTMRARRRNAVAESSEYPVVAAAAKIASASDAASAQPIFGSRRVDVAVLSERDSIFYALIQVGEKTMRYGEMRREDWEVKAGRYQLSAYNAGVRQRACCGIAERMIGDLTTEEVFSEDEFKRLIPDIGL